jgi:hypothetical protein
VVAAEPTLVFILPQLEVLEVLEVVVREVSVQQTMVLLVQRTLAVAVVVVLVLPKQLVVVQVALVSLSFAI